MEVELHLPYSSRLLKFPRIIKLFLGNKKPTSHMRKLVYGINITIDGVVDHHPQTPDDELLLYWAEILRSAGLLVYGRITYEMMVPYWPDIVKNPSGESDADIEFAKVFDSIPKAVFSQSMTEVDDNNSVLYRTKIEDEIRRMKMEPGKDIWLGGVALPSHLIKLGLVDEFHFVIHPVLAGKGRNLPEDISQTGRLKLVDTKVLKSGCVALQYST
ncbi:MAG: dihydrofolate reductase [Bacteroidetes bacterium]|nr:MAG: dihydrofolate reductase [Bacteroidota bacterium]